MEVKPQFRPQQWRKGYKGLPPLDDSLLRQLSTIWSPIGASDNLIGPSGDLISPSGDLTGPSGDLNGPIGDLTYPSGNTL